MMNGRRRVDGSGDSMLVRRRTTVSTVLPVLLSLLIMTMTRPVYAFVSVQRTQRTSSSSSWSRCYVATPLEPTSASELKEKRKHAKKLKENLYLKNLHYRPHLRNKKRASADLDPDFLLKKTEQLLRLTEKYDDRPDNKSTDNNNSSNKMRVNRSTFHWLIDSWFMHEGGQLHAEKLIKRMQELHERGSSNFRPSPRKRHALVVAWSRSGEPDRAEASLYGFDKDEPPSASSYNAVVDAYAKSGRPDAVDKAENILRRMHSKNSKVVPNTSTYNSLLNAYAKSGRPDAAYKAEETLERMIDGSAGPDASPDVTSFSTVVHAWARSHNFGKAEHALKVMDKMSEVATGCSPNVIVVNAVMNACAFTRDNELEGGRALEIAHRMLQRLDGHKSKLRPDDVTYGTYLKVCANHMPDDDDSEEKLRKRVSEAVFKRCCRDGQVGELVLQQLRTLVKDDEGYRRLTGTNRDDPLEELPEEWRCNVRERKSRRI